MLTKSHTCNYTYRGLEGIVSILAHNKNVYTGTALGEMHDSAHQQKHAAHNLTIDSRRRETAKANDRTHSRIDIVCI
jgi:hypothetical protein